jgi:hypothetical protein
MRALIPFQPIGYSVTAMASERTLTAYTRPILALAGFAAWASFAVMPLFSGHVSMREAWDTSAYWSVGIPLLLAVQMAGGALLRGPCWGEPLWTLGGHFLGVVLLRNPGSSLSLFPLAVIFVGGPMYLVLFAAACAGRYLRDLMSPRA